MAALPASGKIRRLLVNIALVLISIVLALVLAETIVGRILGIDVMASGLQSIFEYNPTLGWSQRLNSSSIIEHPSYRIEAKVNSRGLRDREYDYARTPGKKRILVLGDSMAWGFGSDLDKVFTKRLENLMTDTEVIGAGVPGYSTDQELLWLETEGFKYKADLVTLVLFHNDVRDNNSNIVYGFLRKPKYVMEPDGSLRLTCVPVPEASPLYRLVAPLVGCTALALQLYSGYRTDEVGDGHDVRLTTALVKKVGMKAKETGSAFVVAAVCWGRPNCKAVAADLKRDGMLVCDLDKTTGFEGKAMQIVRDGHWNELGNEYVARHLLAVIYNNNLLGAPDCSTAVTPASYERKDGKGDPLAVACGNGCREVAAGLLDKGAPVNARDYFGWSPLTRATVKGSIDTATLLLEHGAQIDAEDITGRTALMWACVTGKNELTGLLVARGADVNIRNRRGVTALMYASAQGNLKAVDILLDHGADVNALDDEGWPALKWATVKNQDKVAKRLSERGAAPEPAK